MRVLFVTGREITYPRNDVLLRAFGRFAEVTSIAPRTRQPLLLASMQGTARALRHLARRDYDLVFVGFYGHLLALPLGWLSGRPLLFDAFVSTYDTLCYDRRRFSSKSVVGGLARMLDRASCHIANTVLLDTRQHELYFAEVLRVPASKLTSLPVGCNEDLFYPRPPTCNAPTRVLYYCSYMPLHGVDTVLRAAASLRGAPLRFRLVGSGQEYGNARSLAERLSLDNVEFLPDVPLVDLPREIAAADICLGGHFGQTGKAGRVIPGKIYQILAMARPLIAAETPANRELLTHGEDSYLSPPGAPDALAHAILEISKDPLLRRYLGANGRKLYEERCSEEIITQTLRQIAQSMLER